MKTILLENQNEITDAITKLKNCEVEFKQVTFPDNEAEATFYLIGWSVDDEGEQYRRFVSEAFDKGFKDEIERKINDENWSLRTNVNHDIQTIWDYLANGLSIDLGYEEASYTFSKSVNGERLDLTYEGEDNSKVIGEITEATNQKFVVEIYEDSPYGNAQKYNGIVEMEDIHKLNEMLEFEGMVAE